MAEGKSFTVQILTPQREVFRGEAVSLVAPGALGYLGVLVNHAPLVTTLKPGKIVCREAPGATRVFELTGGGFLEVRGNQAAILADAAAPAGA